MEYIYPPYEREAIHINKLKNPISIEIINAINHNDFCILIEVGKILNTALEYIELEIDIQRHQYIKNDIRYKERILIEVGIYPIFPRVFALRESFPKLPHQNLIEYESPKCLCLYDQVIDEIWINWTASSFVEIIRTWFSLSSQNLLHKEDQPLEPFILNTTGIVILPNVLSSGTSLQIKLIVSKNENYNFIASYENSLSTNKNDFKLIFVTIEAITHGFVNREPKNLYDLIDLLNKIAIRNQWIQRFCELFLQTNLTPDWISRDIRNPKFMTFVTYQGLHAACNNWRVDEEKLESEEEETEETEETNGNGKATNPNLDNIVSGLKAQKIKTIVVDEAHHLKNEWWQTLTKVKEKLDPIIVGLTATPPYDVKATEWQRYIDLNGSVDTEISVPELVIEGDLCPHQDYVYFTLPTDKENQSIVDFRQNIEKLFQEIKSDETIIKAIEQHPIWQNPTEQLDWIYNNLSYYSACLIFLKANDKEIPETHLEVIGDKKFEIPKLDYEWIETLLDFYLLKEKEHFKTFEEHQKNLENRLRRYGAIERRQINFSHNKKVTGFLTSSISKLNGIKEIVDFEYKNLGSNLRIVILSDFIRKEFYINAPDNNLELNKIGVIPIFEKLRRENKENKKIAVLTGSMIIIPVSAFPAFEAKAAKYGITQINSNPVPFDNNYILISQTEQLKHDIVHIVTQIFQRGEIEVLIGTKSLLGEGWDAPAINSVILASFVGSFVLSNQMRGRAIRTQNGNGDKTGNIWHLVCIDPTSTTGGDDFDLLKRRFRSFVGVSFKEEPGIENGIGRLNLPENIHQKEEAEKKNLEMFTHAGDRESLKQRWKEALATGVNLVEEIKIPFLEEREYKTVKSMYLDKTIKNLLATLGSGLVGFGLESFQGLGRAARNIKTTQDLYVFLAILGTIGMAIFGRQTIKTFKLYFKYRDISKDIQQIGDALLNSLVKAGAIRTDNSKLKVETSVDNWGAVYCHLEGGTTFDKSTFINALQEIIAPIDNPRYVIIRKNRFMLFVKQKDYHSVPEILGRNKNLAEYFQSQWERLVGACDLIFTRTIDGRKLLLKSRVKSLAAQFDNKVEHVNKWR